MSGQLAGDQSASDEPLDQNREGRQAGVLLAPLPPCVWIACSIIVRARITTSSVERKRALTATTLAA